MAAAARRPSNGSWSRCRAPLVRARILQLPGRRCERLGRGGDLSRRSDRCHHRRQRFRLRRRPGLPGLADEHLRHGDLRHGAGDLHRARPPRPTLAVPANDTSELSNFAVVKTFSIGDASVVESNAGTTSLLVTLTRSTPPAPLRCRCHRQRHRHRRRGLRRPRRPAGGLRRRSDHPDGDRDGQRRPHLRAPRDPAPHPVEPELQLGHRRRPGTRTILNDDTVPNRSISDVAQLEATAARRRSSSPSRCRTRPTCRRRSSFRFIRLGDFSRDFAPFASSFILPPQVTSQTITIEVVGDTTLEADETFFVSIASPAPGGGTVIIVDPQGQARSRTTTRSPSSRSATSLRPRATPYHRFRLHRLAHRLDRARRRRLVDRALAPPVPRRISPPSRRRLSPSPPARPPAR